MINDTDFPLVSIGTIRLDLFEIEKWIFFLFFFSPAKYKNGESLTEKWPIGRLQQLMYVLDDFILLIRLYIIDGMRCVNEQLNWTPKHRVCLTTICQNNLMTFVRFNNFSFFSPLLNVILH